MNRFKEENIKLKTRIQQNDQEMEKKDKIIQSLLLQQNNQQGASPIKAMRAPLENHLTLSLKKQIKDMKNEMKTKEEEILQLKKNFKTSKIQEIEVEAKMFADECLRLKRIIEEIVKEKQINLAGGEVNERVYQQNAVINSLKNENQELRNALQKERQEVQKWKDTAGQRSENFDYETKENEKKNKMNLKIIKRR